jgi:hypothetical protein
MRATLEWRGRGPSVSGALLYLRVRAACDGAEPRCDAERPDPRIEGYTGLKLMAAFDEPLLDKSTRRDARYARQNGIHVSPSFMIDRIFQADMSSGDEVSRWAEKLG